MTADIVIEATGHTEVIDEAVAATCTTAGKTEGKHCSVCGEVTVAQNDVDALGHTASGVWVETIAPTYEAEGLEVQYCTVCGEIAESRPVDKLVQVGPDENALYNMRFNGATLSLMNNLAINFKVPADKIPEGFTNPYAKFIIGDQEYIVTEYEIESDGRYVFQFANIPAHFMNETVYAYICATYSDGEVYDGRVLEYGIYKYAYSTLGKAATPAKDKTLIVDLLNYGAAAQIKKGYNVDALVNADLTAEQAGWGTAAKPAYQDLTTTKFVTIENPTASFKGVQLVLDTSVCIRARFVPGADTENVKVTTENGQEWIIPLSECEFIDASQGYYVYLDKLNANQMREAVYFTACDAEGNAVSNTLRYSICSYAARTTSGTTDLLNLLEAMIKYGDSAAAAAK